MRACVRVCGTGFVRVCARQAAAQRREPMQSDSTAGPAGTHVRGPHAPTGGRVREERSWGPRKEATCSCCDEARNPRRKARVLTHACLVRRGAFKGALRRGAPTDLCFGLVGRRCEGLVQEQPQLELALCATPKWDQAKWDQAKWDQAKWDQAKWDQAKWDQPQLELALPRHPIPCRPRAEQSSEARCSGHKCPWGTPLKTRLRTRTPWGVPVGGTRLSTRIVPIEHASGVPR
jgi:hypothetical protein